MENKLIIGEDGICPQTGNHCDDECCPTGAECNISPEQVGDVVDANNSKELENAVAVLCKELDSDESYYISWKANIAMAFKDEFHRKAGKPVEMVFVNADDVHEIANQAADNFLKLLIEKI